MERGNTIVTSLIAVAVIVIIIIIIVTGKKNKAADVAPVDGGAPVTDVQPAPAVDATITPADVAPVAPATEPVPAQ